MGKNFQLLVASFLIIIAGGAIYFGIRLQSEITNLKEVNEVNNQKISQLSGALQIFRDLGAVMGKEDLPPEIARLEQSKVTLKTIEGFYCSPSDSEEFVVIDFAKNSILSIWNIVNDEESNEVVNIDRQSKPNVSGNYILFSPYIYVSFLEDGRKLNKRLTILNVDSRGYIRQLGDGSSLLSNQFCPTYIRDSY